MTFQTIINTPISTSIKTLAFSPYVSFVKFMLSCYYSLSGNKVNRALSPALGVIQGLSKEVAKSLSITLRKLYTPSALRGTKGRGSCSGMLPTHRLVGESSKELSLFSVHGIIARQRTRETRIHSVYSVAISSVIAKSLEIGRKLETLPIFCIIAKPRNRLVLTV